MATANVIELETCLAGCIDYCAAHPEHEFVKYFAPRLDHARERWEESVRESDHYFIEWQREVIDSKLAWKKLGRELKATQNALRKINAIGYPSQTVLHWDEEILAAAVEEMIGYLESRTDQISIAAERIDALKRALDLAQGDLGEESSSFREFNRHVLFRSEAMGTLSSTLADFRVTMRHALGKDDAEYRSIRWPISLAPDEPVL